MSKGSDSRCFEVIGLIFYSLLLLVVLSTLAATFTNHPLIPLQTDSLEWSNAWLIATAVDYYGTCLCFCGVVAASEASWWSAILWVIACCVARSPACCLYVFLWLTKEGGTLRLKRQNSELPARVPTPPKDNSADDTTVESHSESKLPSPGYARSNSANAKANQSQPQHQEMTQLQQCRHHRINNNAHKSRDVERAVIS